MGKSRSASKRRQRAEIGIFLCESRSHANNFIRIMQMATAPTGSPWRCWTVSLSVLNPRQWPEILALRSHFAAFRYTRSAGIAVFDFKFTNRVKCVFAGGERSSAAAAAPSVARARLPCSVLIYLACWPGSPSSSIFGCLRPSNAKSITARPRCRCMDSPR